MGKGKEVKRRVNPNNRKQAKQKESPESFYDQNPKWSFKNMDLEHERWSLSKCDEIYAYILKKLMDFEKMKWSEIVSTSGGKKNGNNHHFENVNGFIKEAQDRWLELKLEAYTEVFSLRLTGTHRLYGILEEGVFRIIWFDENHEIYKSKKRHT